MAGCPDFSPLQDLMPGLLIGKGGLHGNVFRIAPALNVEAREIDEALAILADAFATRA